MKHNFTQPYLYVLFISVAALASACGTKQSAIDEELDRLVGEFNAACPMMVDNETRLDSVATRHDGFHYYYTLVNLMAGQIDTAAFRKFMQPGLTEGAKTNADLEYFRAHKVPLAYHYHDKAGAAVQTIFLEPGDFAK